MSKKIKFDKVRYRQLCRDDLTIPIFFQDWWLDAACRDGDWEVMLYEEDPNIVAILPYFIKRKGPFRYITMPPLTKFAGPYFLKSFPERKQHSILVKMVEALPAMDGYQQTLHYQIQNWLPYKWKGFRQTAYYSYVIPDISDLERVYENIAPDYRNNKFKKAQDSVTIKAGLDHDRLIDICKQPFIRQGDKMPVAEDYLSALLKIVEEKGSGLSLYAEDRAGNTQAAIYLIWDAHATYLLFTGEYESFRSTGSGIYALWKGIEFAHQNNPGKTFDFLGGMSEGVERTRRQFGAVQQTYFYVWRKKLIFRMIQKLLA